MSSDNRLQPGEMEIDTSLASYFPPGGEKYKGNLTVTNRRLIFQGTVDPTLKHQTGPGTLIKWDGAGRLEIDRREIRKLEANDSGLTRRCTLILRDGSRHAFDYGEKQVDNVLAELRKAGRKSGNAKPASLGMRLLKIVISDIVMMIVSDIVGVIVCTLLDLRFTVFKTVAAFYALWMVLGLFTGFFMHYFAGGMASPDFEGDWTNRQDAAKTGTLVCVATIPLLAGLLWVIRRWSGSGDSIYVPDNMGLSIAYFIAIAIGVGFAQIIIPKAGGSSLRLRHDVRERGGESDPKERARTVDYQTCGCACSTRLGG